MPEIIKISPIIAMVWWVGRPTRTPTRQKKIKHYANYTLLWKSIIICIQGHLCISVLGCYQKKFVNLCCDAWETFCQVFLGVNTIDPITKFSPSVVSCSYFNSTQLTESATIYVFFSFITPYGHNLLLLSQCYCYCNWEKWLPYEILSGKDLVMD